MKHFLAFIALALVGCGAGKKAATIQNKDAAVKQTCFCGRGRSDVSTIYRAVAAGDTDAVAGLLSRGKAIRLEGATRVRVVGVSDQTAYVRILSGYQAGETCWLPDSLLIGGEIP